MEIKLFDIFRWGIDYGQLIMENERNGEDLADAFQGAIIDERYSMPSSIAPRRQPHSDEWRCAKKKGFENFMKLYLEMKNSNEMIFVE